MDEYDLIDAGLYLFDYRRFHERVVPAFRRLHADDDVEPWLETAWRSTRRQPSLVPRFTRHLREVTAELMASPDLTGDLPRELIPAPTRRPKRRRSPIDRSASRQADWPIEHEAVRDWLEWRDLQYLLQVAVEATCLGDSVKLTGHTVFDACVDGDRYQSLYYDPDVVPLREWLEERAVAWVQDYDHNWVGIRGWLDPDESWLLAEGLAKYRPVHDAATFEAIEAARVDGSAPCSDGGNHPWRLATIRAVAQLAAGRGHGVLWGWDLTSNG
ncbi:hypothetical protein [Virgisporangium aurantiacum]|uniref:Uncharacterized protein n=1 Tax=Virgisporangium aurantiacum TaxID=175570 RepID=A0A8J4E5Y2_9ACTN|nr:hypothetical protein [Virgisporangium aurantiacum]GIJ60327.1 hypothetical protein Vau01_078430 [Virgisporangium aurantiacum]